jgi:hypothetical protein
MVPTAAGELGRVGVIIVRISAMTIRSMAIFKGIIRNWCAAGVILAR